MSSIGLGVVVAVFSLVGFESSTAAGEEAKNPMKTIPSSIIWSLILTGLFFVFVCYTEVLGTRGIPSRRQGGDPRCNRCASLNVLAGKCTACPGWRFRFPRAQWSASSRWPSPA